MAGPRLFSLFLSALALLGLLSVASCRAPERPAGTAGRSATGERQRVDRSHELYVEVCALTQLPYFIDHRLGMEAAGRELGVRAEFVGPADYDMNGMIATLEQTLARRPAGILVVG